jgi:hypothetical protein
MYVQTLTGYYDESVTWQVFDDGPDKDFRKARVLHGTLADVAHELQTANADKRGVFCTVNATDGAGRKRENIRKVRALFVDCDTERPSSWHLPPSMVVESAAGPHAYWCVADCELDAFAALQKRLAAFYRSDPKVCDLPRVMRVPGFWHCKREPVRVQLAETLGEVYEVANVMQAIPELQTPPLSPYARSLQPSEREPLLPSERRKLAKWREIDPLQAFQQAGMYGRHVRDDKHAVVCPWIHEHTSRDYTGQSGDTVLWTQGTSGPVFHCAHAHCDGRYLAHALAEIGAMGG